jgi:hypothetical protein
MPSAGTRHCRNNPHLDREIDALRAEVIPEKRICMDKKRIEC